MLLPQDDFEAQAKLLSQRDLTGAGTAVIPHSTVFGSSHMRESGHLLRQAAVPADSAKQLLLIEITKSEAPS